MEDISYYPGPVPENTEDLKRYLNDELIKIGNALRPESWIEIDSTNAPQFVNSWDNSGGTQETAAIYKDTFDIVRFKGNINTGTSGTVAFTLFQLVMHHQKK